MSSSSFPKATMTPPSSNSNSNMDDEPRWVIQMRKTLEEEVDQDENETPICISNVPKALMAFKPEAYIPQQVALGPYHHWRPELHEMSRHKLVAAKKTKKQLNNNGLKFQHIIDHIMKLDHKTRASYQKYLDFNSETLAWVLAVDASFLLQFLEVYAIKEGKSSLFVTRSSTPPLLSSHRMSHFIDYTGRKSSHNVILRDIMMLENQIPLFLLRKILEIQYSSLEIADDILYSMLVGICKEVTPFKMMDLNSSEQTPISVKLMTECAHLLDFLYHMLVPRKPKPAPPTTQDRDYSEINQAEDDDDDDDDDVDEDLNNREPSKDDKDNKNRESFGTTSHVQQLFIEVWRFLYKLNQAPIRLLKAVLLSKPVKLALQLPWAVISRLPVFSLLKQPIEQLFFSQDKEEIKPENEGSSKNMTNAMNKPPLMEEITIPSVTELYKAGVRFLPTNGNIDSISFDVKKATLYLPSVSLDVNTDVILRNLVAYEASTVSGPLVFTRYTELMNGIIDTDEDSKLLREKGIVLNHLKSDEEVANLWNGMNKSVRLTKVPLLDKLIEDVNKYYNGKWRVKVMKFMKTYVFGSWQFLTFLAAILLLLMTGLQAFCTVYTCARILRVQAITTN